MRIRKMNKLKQKYFEIWADEEAQNSILKWLLVFSFVVITAQTSVLCVLSLRKPVLIAIGEKDTQVLTFEKPKPDLLRSELSRTVQKYVEAHYNWDFNTIEFAHKDAAKYVADKFQKSFIGANQEQIKQARERKVIQHVYLSKPVEVDTEKLTARVTVDRIFSVEGLKATAPLTLEISFEYGPRTEMNPEGVYITGEKLVTEVGK